MNHFGRKPLGEEEFVALPWRLIDRRCFIMLSCSQAVFYGMLATFDPFRVGYNVKPFEPSLQ